jgi:plasmid stabilization system protein ParE
LKPVTFHSEAEWDLHQAIGFYEILRRGLGRELGQEVKAALARIASNPHTFPLHGSGQGIRKCLVHRFPYTIFYVVVEEAIWVAAVSHQSRKPHHWRNRRPE